MRLELEDEDLRSQGFMLYDELEEINHTEIVGDVETGIDIEL